MPDSDALLMLKAKESAPALSATTDKPSLVETPAETKEPVANESEQAVDSESAAAQAKTPETSAPSDEAHSGDDPAANAEGGTKPPKGVQKRIDELTRQRGDAERLASEQSKRLDKALELIERLSGASASDAQLENRQDDPRPTREQFDDPDAYTEHLSAWSGRQAVKAYQIEQSQIAQQIKQAEEFKNLTTRWEEGRDKAIEAHPDYLEVAENENLLIPQHVGFAVVHNANGNDILYWLGKNPAEAARIAALDPPMAVMEIGAIGARLAAADRPGVSKAPAPVKPLGGRNDAASVSPEADPNYMERRLQELRTKKH